MNTGEEDIFQTAHILSWNNQTELSKWGVTDSLNACNQINGTDSSYYRPFRTTEEPENLFVFKSDICR